MQDFLHRTPASRLVFGVGSIARLGDELDLLGLGRVMLLSGPRTAASSLHAGVLAAIGARVAARFDEVPAHGSVDVVMHLVELARASAIDGFVAVGGGSASDTAKAVALMLAEGGSLEDHASRFTPPDRLVAPALNQPKLPIVAVPSTASAAEVTPSLGVRTRAGHKLLFSDLQLASRLIVIDPQATREVPASLLLSTGMNGLAHCVEGLYSAVRTPVTQALACEGIRLFMAALPALAERPDDLEARGDVFAAAHLSGQVLLNARTCLHHALCHALGAATGIGHGDANSVMLAAVMAFNAGHAEAQLALGARAMGLPAQADALVRAVGDLQRTIAVPRRLRDLGVEQSMLPAVARTTMHERGLMFNPRRVVDARELEVLLQSVW